MQFWNWKRTWLESWIDNLAAIDVILYIPSFNFIPKIIEKLKQKISFGLKSLLLIS
ncbi:hypothetical protein Tsubulata_041680 [Turnera subulata]|uniref:Uncharacterized protein n=1 Tax=Turnera subulata TaxID=218843 RepID=A0A9Q0FLF9_9ROSI|nr:hypothetical protein Tsubulata_017819 [Turnera subulata]KAJ4824484.1 hypothetical protein Tsubulata_033134 [Turnera subulata]KAJ4832612.1 hypothetical protein Tsubulata_027166 [Turnera subulata]KAJ4836982.1 hypothetical protein Tsubulata_011265 [Turnera subulata]KAJ4841982.1 hypothetical protein Tsubulata_005407 [Turnera subulata]